MKLQDNLLFFFIASLFFCLASVITALVTFPITNLTLVFYSLSVPFIWKASLLLEWQAKRLSSSAKKKQVVFFCVVFACFYLFTSVLSSFSCILLFPHPFIHKILIAIIYFTGMIMALKIHYLAYCILSEKMSSVMLLKHKIQENYNTTCSIRDEYKDEKWEPYFASRKFQPEGKDHFHYNGKKYVLRRLASTGLYVFLFLWIFAIIPLLYLDKLRALYIFGISTTIIISLVIMVRTFLQAYITCDLFPHGIIIQSCNQKNTLHWEDIESITIKDTNFVIKAKKSNYFIPFYTIQSKHELEFLKHFLLQGSLLFSKKTQSADWINIDFLKNLLKEKGRKLSSEAVLKKIDSESIYILDKDNCFCIRKTEDSLEVFNGKLPYSLYFITEPFWKQLVKYLKKHEEKLLETFKDEYVKRASSL